MCKRANPPLKKVIVQAKLIITFNNACPAIMFANNRTDKLIGRKRNETSSIGTSNNARTNGEPEGKKNAPIFTPCFRKLIIFAPTNRHIARENVIMI